MDKNKHFLVGIFGDEDVLMNAVKKVRAKGVKIHEVFTPYPVHFLEDALGYKRSWMPRAAFGFGLTGTICAIAMQTWIMGIDWPMIFGGKSFIAVPDFVPVTFEMTVLFAAFGMAFTFFGIRNLKPHAVPRVFDRRQSDDKHVMAIDLAANKLTEAEIQALLAELNAEEVYRKDFTDADNDPSFVQYVIDLFTKGVQESARELK